MESPPKHQRDINYKSIKKMVKQMEECICKIKVGSNENIGIFCKIPFPNESNLLPVLITTNLIINEELLYKKEESISIFILKEEEKKLDHDEIKLVDLNNRIKYTNKKYDITIIEIKEQDNIKNYLELDDNIIDDILDDNKTNEIYKQKELYMIKYSKDELSVSFGVLDSIDSDQKYKFTHQCITSFGSSGSPIFNINNKLIGIQKGIETENGTHINIGTFLNFPIKEFIKANYSLKGKENLSNIIVKVANEVLLDTFKNKYALDIKDNNIDILDLKNKDMENDGLIE